MAQPKLDTRGSHVFTKDKKQNRWFLSSVHPIQWFVGEGTRVAIQDGTFFTSGGEALRGKAIPAWAADALSKLSPAHRASLGFGEPIKPAAA